MGKKYNLTNTHRYSNATIQRVKALKLTPLQEAYVYAITSQQSAGIKVRAIIIAKGLQNKNITKEGTPSKYSTLSASATQLEKNVAVQQAIDILSVANIRDRENIAEEVMTSALDIVTLDRTEAFLQGDDGEIRLKRLQDIPVRLRRMIDSVERTKHSLKVTFADRSAARAVLAKAIGLDRDVVASDDDYAALLTKLTDKSGGSDSGDVIEVVDVEGSEKKD